MKTTSYFQLFLSFIILSFGFSCTEDTLDNEGPNANLTLFRSIELFRSPYGNGEVSTETRTYYNEDKPIVDSIFNRNGDNNELSIIYNYYYNDNGLLWKLQRHYANSTDDDLTRIFNYDNQGRLIAISDNVTFSYNGNIVTRTAIINQNTFIKHFVLDSNNNVIGVQSSDNIPIISINYEGLNISSYNFLSGDNNYTKYFNSSNLEAPQFLKHPEFGSFRANYYLSQNFNWSTDKVYMNSGTKLVESLSVVYDNSTDPNTFLNMEYNFNEENQLIKAVFLHSGQPEIEILYEYD